MIDARPAWRNRLARHLTFSTRGQIVRARLAVCLLTLLAPLLCGQGVNWDLRNYHLCTVTTPSALSSEISGCTVRCHSPFVAIAAQAVTKLWRQG